MQEHTMRLEEKEFRLFQTIRKMLAGPEEKELLLESLIQQIENFVNSENLAATETTQPLSSERRQSVVEQFREAERLYKEHSEMIISERNSSVEWDEDLFSAQISSNAYKEWLQTENDIYDELFKDEFT